MCSEVPRYIQVTVMIGLFSDLMKFTVVNERLSVTTQMFCLENNSANSTNDHVWSRMMATLRAQGQLVLPLVRQLNGFMRRNIESTLMDTVV